MDGISLRCGLEMVALERSLGGLRDISRPRDLRGLRDLRGGDDRLDRKLKMINSIQLRLSQDIYSYKICTYR